MKKNLSVFVSFLIVIGNLFLAAQAQDRDIRYSIDGHDGAVEIAYTAYPEIVEGGIGNNTTNVLKFKTNLLNSYYYFIPPMGTKRDSDNYLSKNKKYIFHGDFYVENANKAAGEKTTNWYLGLENAGASGYNGISVDASAGENPSNENYRYYSYFPSNTGNIFSAGYYPRTINADGSADTTWGNCNQFEMTYNEWVSKEALVAKPADNSWFSVQPFKAESAYSEDGDGDSVFYGDNITFQELSLDNISLFVDGNSINNGVLEITPNSSAVFSASVYNQFGSELGFKDQVGTVMEPLKFTVTDKNGNTVSDNNYFEVNDTERPANEKVCITTEKKTTALKVAKNGISEWVTPTYNFTVETKGLEAGEYTVTAQLLNSDIYGSEKTAQFTLKVIKSVNLLSNGDFENGTTGWTVDGAGNKDERIFETVYDNELSSNVVTAKLNQIHSESVNMKAGVPYIVSFKAKSLEESSPRINIDFSAQTGDIYKGGKWTENNPIKDKWYDIDAVCVFDEDSDMSLGIVAYTSEWKYGAYSADNVYIGKMALNSKIEAPSELIIPKTGDADIFYTLSVNQTSPAGNAISNLKNNVSTTAKWSLKENYVGVSIDANTGELTITDKAAAGNIIVICESQATVSAFNGAERPSGGSWTVKTLDGTYKDTAEKTIVLKENIQGTNLVINPDFENGSIYPWLEDDPKNNTLSVVNDNGSNVLNKTGAFYQPIELEADEFYIISAKVKNLHEDKAYLRMILSPGVINERNVEAGTWKDMSCVFYNTEAGEQNLRLYGLWESNTGKYANISADDIYAGKFALKNTVSAPKEIMLSDSVQSFNCTVDVTNGVGNKVGITQPTVKWSLKEAYEGVSIDEDTGVVTVQPSAAAGKITVKCTASETLYSGDISKTYTSEAEIETELVLPDIRTVVTGNTLKVDVNSAYRGKQIIMAVYGNDGILKEITFNNALSFTKDFSEDSEAKSVKIFVWDALDNLKPLCPEKSCEVK